MASKPPGSSQAWFFSEHWQSMEREADDDIRHGRVHWYGGADDMLADLDRQAVATSRPHRAKRS